MNLLIFFTQWRWHIAAALAALALLGATYAKGRHDGSASEKRAEAVRLERARKVDARAQEAANVQRPKDAAKVAQAHKELTDADNAVPDSVPSDARRALACARLRQQTRDPRQLPPGC